MLQIIGVIAAFVLILVLVNRKVHLMYAMGAACLALALTSSIGVSAALGVAWRSAIARPTIEFALTVALIGLLARLMQTFDLLSRMVDALVKLLRSTRAALVAVPGIIGLLPVLGGAVISAPLVDRLADRLEYSPDRRAAINLVFRHIWFFVYPFGPSLILASQLSGVSVQSLGAHQWPIMVVGGLVGYWWLLRPGPREPAQTEPWNPGRDLPAFLINGGPLLLSLALALVVHLPLYLSLLGGIVLAALLGSGHNKFGAATFWRGIDWRLVASMFFVMIFRGLMEAGGVVAGVVASLAANGWPTAVFFAVIPLLVGLISASQSTSIAICFPLLMPMLRPGDPLLPYVSLMFTATFLAYFGSPLHMCQILTLEHFKCRILSVYKSYWPFILSIAGTAAVLFAISV